MPDVSTYLSHEDYERLKLRCLMRKVTIYRYSKEVILHVLEQIEKHGIEYLSEDAINPKKKKRKSGFAQMPVIELDT